MLRCVSNRRWCLAPAYALVVVAALSYDRSCWADAPVGRAITAVAVDAAGAVQAGVMVELWRFEGDSFELKVCGPPQTTDAAGRVRFADPATGDHRSFLLRASDSAGRFALRQVTLIDAAAVQEVALALRPTIAQVLAIRDEQGQPIDGANLAWLRWEGANGKLYLFAQQLATLGLLPECSDAGGLMRLPPLPADDEVALVLRHESFAPVRLDDVHLQSAAPVEAVMQPGVQVTLELRAEGGVELPTRVAVRIDHVQSRQASEYTDEPVRVGADGKARLTIAAGNYSYFSATHPEVLIGPTYDASSAAAQPMQILPGRDTFAFHVRRKQRVQGRVVNELTGESVPNVGVRGEVQFGDVQGPFGEHAPPWSPADWVDADNQGRFELTLAAGSVRIQFADRGYYNTPAEYLEFRLDAAGQPEPLELHVRPLPVVRGRVYRPDGRPAEGAIVRLAQRLAVVCAEPTISDADGRFELALHWLPIDIETERPVWRQPLVAYDPHEPLAARAPISLDQPDSFSDVSLTLTPEPRPGALVIQGGDLNDSERPPPDSARWQERQRQTLQGTLAEELDGAAWLNAPDNALSLAALRGQYVLLDFWTTWCGPCHADFPRIKRLQALYQGRGLTIIGVHDNSMPLEAIRADAEKNGLTFPIVVDQPQGGIIDRYRITAFPSYVLIGPDGTILADRHTNGPALRNWMTELIRERLLAMHVGK